MRANEEQKYATDRMGRLDNLLGRFGLTNEEPQYGSSSAQSMHRGSRQQDGPGEMQQQMGQNERMPPQQQQQQ